MAKLTLEELRALRAEKQQAARRSRAEGHEVQVIIGVGTCGLAAGAKAALDAFVEEIDRNKLMNVSLRQTGCMGLCFSEPTVEVIMPDMPPIVYGKVDADTARRIVRKHIIGKLLINDHIYDRPAADTWKPAPAAGKA
jgi:NADP-reducing hydrogenase subunit HndB